MGIKGLGEAKLRHITRHDNPGRGWVGWQVRFRWGGLTRSKWFPDADGGPATSLACAVAWRNLEWEEMGRPMTERRVVKPPNGNVGVHVRLKDGRKVFEVTWSPEAGKVSRTTVSIDRYGYNLAQELAMLMRALMEFEHYGGTLVSRPGMFSTLRSNLVREEGRGGG